MIDKDLAGVTNRWRVHMISTETGVAEGTRARE